MATEPLANILVVDDSEAICRALRDLLTMSGYTVRTAPSGERALQILETASMDLVITDLKMSGISGIQLLKKIKEKTPALPVVILTALAIWTAWSRRCGTGWPTTSRNRSRSTK